MGNPGVGSDQPLLADCAHTVRPPEEIHNEKPNQSHPLACLLGFRLDCSSCIGFVSNSLGDDCDNDSQKTKKIIWAFWAPFLLLHLGGPDTITAYAMEDNELWLRRFLGLLAQFGGAFYIFLLAWKGMPLNILAIPIFVAGLIKYGERTWALRSASSSHFRGAMLPCPDPGPNYAKIMGEYTLQRNQVFNVSLRPVIEPSTRVNCLDPDAPILQVGNDLFNTFKRFFADLILTFQDREKSQSFFQYDLAESFCSD